MRDVAIIAAQALRDRLASPRADGERPLGVSPINCEQILAEVYSVEVVDVDSISGPMAGGYVAEMTSVPPLVRLSRRWPALCRNWTLAHEIGHLELDGQINRVHRDPPSVFRDEPGAVPIGEVRANRFAQAFLLPEEEVRLQFCSTFGVTAISTADVSDEMQIEFGYTPGIRSDLIRFSKSDPVSLARCLAAVTVWGGRFFRPMTGQFGVSITVMSRALLSYGLVCSGHQGLALN